MSRQAAQSPVHRGAVRVYVPDADGDEGYHPRLELISELRIHDRGPDVMAEVFVRGLKSGALLLPASDETLFRRRLFVDPPVEDRSAVVQLIHELEEAAISHRVEDLRQAKRRLLAYVDQLRCAISEPPAARGRTA